MILFNTVCQEDLERMHDGSFPLPPLDLCISKKTVVADGKPVAIGLIRLTSEILLFTDPSTSALTRARAVKALEEPIRGDLKSLRIPDCHAFVKQRKIQKILEHLGFFKLNETPMAIKL